MLEEVIRLKLEGLARFQIIERLNISEFELRSIESKIRESKKPKPEPKRKWIRRKCLKERNLMKKIYSFKKKIKESNKQEHSKEKIRRVLQKKIGAFSRNKDGTQMNEFNVDGLLEKIGDNPVCYLTGKPIDLSKSRSYELDHIVPKSKGGTNELDNCNIATAKANRAKSDMTLEEFIDLCKSVVKHNSVSPK